MFSLLFCLFVQWCFFYRSFVAVEEAKGDDDEIVIKFRLLFHRFDLTWSFVVVNTVIVCPEEADYAPCNCIEDDLKPDTIYNNKHSYYLFTIYFCPTLVLFSHVARPNWQLRWNGIFHWFRKWQINQHSQLCQQNWIFCLSWSHLYWGLGSLPLH